MPVLQPGLFHVSQPFITCLDSGAESALFDCRCRFVVNLDPATMQMNAQLLQRAVPPQVQTPEQIEAIVKQARVAQAAVSPNWAEGL